MKSQKDSDVLALIEYVGCATSHPLASSRISARKHFGRSLDTAFQSDSEDRCQLQYIECGRQGRCRCRQRWREE